MSNATLPNRITSLCEATKLKQKIEKHKQKENTLFVWVFRRHFEINNTRGCPPTRRRINLNSKTLETFKQKVPLTSNK